MSDLELQAHDPLATRMRFNGFGPTFQRVLREVADDFGRRLTELVQAGATVASAVLEELDRAVPGNWDELTIPQIEAVARRMDESRCNLAWVPRGKLVAEVLAAPPGTAPIALLLGRREDVIADLQATFDTLAATSALGFRVQAPQEALASFRDGRLIAAQGDRKRCAHRRGPRTHERGAAPQGSVSALEHRP